MSIIVKDLSKLYGEQYAVDHVSFEAKAGEILGFLGPNGAGKSTTMKIATTYLPPSSGTVEICGIDVIKEPLAVRAKVGYLPEHNPLYLDMYVVEYLGFAASMHQMSNKDKKKQIAQTIELVGLGKEQHKLIGALSKGYRQRVGLAQALLHNPEVLILDEPTTGFDPNQVLEIREVIKNISKEKTVIFSTHIMQEVQALCDRVVIINNGKIVANSAIETLGQQQERKLKLAFEGVADLAILAAIEGVTQVKPIDKVSCFIYSNIDCRSAIFQAAVSHGMTIVEMTPQKESLEQLFKQLTITV